MHLYEIDRLIENAINLGFDSETGEVLGFEELEALQMERTEKLTNIGLWVKDMLAEIDMIKAEEKKLADRRKAVENRADSVKTFLANHLEDGEKIKTGNLAISWRKSEVVQTCDVDALPDFYCRTKVTVEPDKAKIKEDLKKGMEIEGCYLEVKNNLTIK